MFDLSGKTALVTGASGGLGSAIASALHGQGASVVLSGTRVDALEAVAAELGDRTFVVPANLSDGESLDALAKQAEAATGQLDILVNNAGLTRDNLAMRMKDEDWETVLNVNLTAAFRLSRAVLRGMMKRRWGRIVGITSIVGVTGNPGRGLQGGHDRNVEIACPGSGQPRDHGQLSGAGLHRNGDDRCAGRPAAGKAAIGDSGGADGRSGGYRGGCRLSRVGGSLLRHGPDAARQWRDGDDLMIAI